MQRFYTSVLSTFILEFRSKRGRGLTWSGRKYMWGAVYENQENLIQEATVMLQEIKQ